MNNKHRKTLAAVAELPTSRAIVFSDIESMVKGLGGGLSWSEKALEYEWSSMAWCGVATARIRARRTNVTKLKSVENF